MTRKILTGVLAIVAVFALVATASAQTTYSYTRNLTIGSTGADVVALQTSLESMGYLVMPVGVSKGYFGSLTQAALAKYQAAKGITPAAGYFGPITRASFATATTPTVPAVNPCSAVAGTVPTVIGGVVYCLPGTGTTPTTPSTSTTEGTLDVDLAPTPSNNANIRTSTDVPVYGLRLEGRIADVTVDRVDLQVAVAVGSSKENPANFIHTIKAWDGSNAIKTWNVTSADFIKSGSTYYVRLSGLNFVVPKDTTKTLTFSFSTSNSIDTNRSVTINGYGSNSLRVVSGANVTSYYDIEDSTFTRTHTFKEPGGSTVTLSANANDVDSMNHERDSSDGAQDVIMQTFNVKSETGDSVITDVYVQATSSATAGSTLYLYDGSTLVDSRTWASQVVFTNVEINVPKNVTKTLTIKADFPSNTTSGTVASTTVWGVGYEQPDDSSTTTSDSQFARGNNQYFYPAVPNFTFVSSSVTATSNGDATNTTNISGHFIFRVRPEGGTMIGLSASDIKVATTTTAGAEHPSMTKTVTVIPNHTNYAEGGEYTVDVAFLIPNAAFQTTGLYTFYINQIAWTVGSTSATQTWGLDDFKTAAVAFTK